MAKMGPGIQNKPAEAEEAPGSPRKASGHQKKKQEPQEAAVEPQDAKTSHRKPRKPQESPWIADPENSLCRGGVMTFTWLLNSIFKILVYRLSRSSNRSLSCFHCP